jgi:integrase
MVSPDLRAPCLRKKMTKGGQILWYWQVTRQAAELGFRPTTRRVHGDSDDEILEVCRIYTAEMREWMDIQYGATPPIEELTISRLFREYRVRPESPFNRRLKENSRQTYSQSLDWIEARIGDTHINSINLSVLIRWYNEARWPEGKTGREYLHTAYRVIEMLRRVFSFGIAAEIDGCARVAGILSNTQFERPKPRESAMTRDQAERFIYQALESGRQSLALATALQFECAFRQKDVIGEWLTAIRPQWTTSPLILNRREWQNGLTWADIDMNWQINKRTTKTGAVVAHDLTLAPLSMKILATIPETRRHGPLIIDEKSGRPYAQNSFQVEWRKIANAAGLPKSLWSADARAGAATEASEAGGNLDDIRETMGHSDARTTLRYVRGKKLSQSKRIAALRLEIVNR